MNNAGILRDRTVKKMTPDEWHAVLQTNLDGVFYCSKLGADVLRDGGRIVNIASIAGVVGFHGQANYAAAKAGVIALTKVMSKELARRRITVNAVAPGVIRTPMLSGLKAEVLAEYEKQIPVGRVGVPADVAHAVLFFACEESAYITGQTLPITGGGFDLAGCRLVSRDTPRASSRTPLVSRHAPAECWRNAACASRPTKGAEPFLPPLGTIPGRQAHYLPSFLRIPGGTTRTVSAGRGRRVNGG